MNDQFTLFSSLKIAINFWDWGIGSYPSTYMRVSNFRQNLGFKISIRLIHGATYTRGYTILNYPPMQGCQLCEKPGFTASNACRGVCKYTYFNAMSLSIPNTLFTGG